ncbi:MAG TPA: carboxypeptidase regulatory-like domain-containing protein [Pirellulales bacterium]|nr:carboxypeptidase regulatory-like domain-containing protein [Pirellulales bacterium]
MPSGAVFSAPLTIIAAEEGTADDNLTFAGSATDNQFDLPGLPSGTYDITLYLNGYVTAIVNGVAVVAGQATDVGDVAMTLAASITGTLVSTDPATPASGAIVGAYLGSKLVATAATDDQGTFTISGLAPGAYTVQDVQTSSYQTPQGVTVVAGQAASGVVISLAPGGSIAGSVTDPGTNAPLVGVRVLLSGPAGEFKATSTDSSGAYRFDSLGLGAYTVYLQIAGANSRGMATIDSLDSQLATVNLTASHVAQLSGHLTLSNGSPATGTIDLIQNGQIVGATDTDSNGAYDFLIQQPGTFDLQAIVTGASFAPDLGVAVGEGDSITQDMSAGSASLQLNLTDPMQSVSGASVSLEFLDGASLAIIGTAQADANGQVVFQNLAPGNYLVQVTATGNRGANATVLVAGGAVTTLPVTLGQQAGVSGVVSGPGNSPVSGARIALISTTDPNVHFPMVTDASGAFAINNVPDGIYDIVVLADGFSAYVQSGIQVSGDLVVNPILAASTATVHGVLADSNGAPIGNGIVTITDSSGHLVGQTTTKADGSFTVTSASGPDLTGVASASGYGPVSIATFDATGSVDLGSIQLAAKAIGDPGGFNFQIPQFSWPKLPWDSLFEEVKSFNPAEPARPDSPPTTECFTACEAEYAKAVSAWNDQHVALTNLLEQTVIVILRDQIHAETAVKEIAQDVATLAGAGILIIGLLEVAAAAGIEVVSETTLEGLTGGEAWAGWGLIGSTIDTTLKLAQKGFEAITDPEPKGTLQKAQQAESIIAEVLAFANEVAVAAKNLPIYRYGVAYSAIGFALEWGEIVEHFQLGETKEAAEKFEKDYDKWKEMKQEWEEDLEKFNEAEEEYERCKAEHNGDDDKCHCKENPQDCDSKPPDPKPILPPPTSTWPFPMGFPKNPFDPNDIIGPAGYGDQHFVPADQPMAYEIEFENESAATAPAQEVTITEQLDPKIDPRSFRLGDFGWGGMRFSPPPDSAFYQTTIDETDTLGILVQVTATIDVSTGTAVWDFLSIDPATGEKPLDGGKGFLPPDDGSGSGQGFVSYTVLPNASVQTGDVIHAQATVFFDANAPIDTRTIFNTIDAGDALGSQMAALPANEPTPQFTLSWTPADQGSSGSAVASYSIYVSDNGGAFLPFLLNTTASQALFTGQKGHTYVFYSLATDNAGNQQSPASAVLVSTTVGDAVQSSSGTTILPVGGQSFSGAVATFTGTDPNGQGTDFTAMIDWGDGSSLTAGTISGSAAAGYTVSGSHVYLEEGANLPLKVIVADQANLQTTVSGLANVADAPLTAAAVTFTATEGFTYSGTVATFADADPNGELGDYTAVIDWGDGSSATAGTIAANPGGGFVVTGSHVYVDEGGYAVVVTIADAGGASDTAASAANAADAALGATAVTIHATEGAAFSGAVATFVDANPNGEVGDFTAVIDWGDGSPTTAGAIAANPGGGFVVNGSHVYAEEGASSITVTISDVGGSKATAHSAAQIADAPLTAAGVTISTTEGATFSGVVATFADADPNGEVGDYTAVILWGDGSSSAGAIAAGANGFTVSGSYAYAEEGAALPLSVVISDAGGAKATATGAANVADAPLHMTAAAVSIPTGGAADHVLLATFTDTGGAEPVGDYAAVIDWGDGSPSEAGAIEFSGGVFQIFGSHAYTSAGAFTIGVTVKDEGGATDALTEQASIELTAHQKYVIAVYHDVLARAPDPGGLAYWSQLLDHDAAVSSVAQAIAHSDEYYANFVIKPDYVKLLGREADDSGVTYWTGRMHDGLTDQQLEALLVSSDEFYANAGGTNLAWIDAIYKLLLGRAADSSGESYWTGQLAADQSRQQVAEGIANSAENDAQLINEDYFHYLGREADPDGLAYWLAQFAAGKTNEDIIAGFTGSDEYYQQRTK